MRWVLIILLALITSTASLAEDRCGSSEYPCHVSLIALIANPERHAGDYVYVIGVLFLDHHQNRLFLDHRSRQHAILTNSVTLDLSGDQVAKYGSFNRSHVQVGGKFITSSDRAGPGTVTEVFEEIVIRGKVED